MVGLYLLNVRLHFLVCRLHFLVGSLHLSVVGLWIVLGWFGGYSGLGADWQDG